MFHGIFLIKKLIRSCNSPVGLFSRTSSGGLQGGVGGGEECVPGSVFEELESESLYLRDLETKTLLGKTEKINGLKKSVNSCKLYL